MAREPDLLTELAGGTCGQAVAKRRSTRWWSGPGTQGEQGHRAAGSEHSLAWTGRQMRSQPFQASPSPLPPAPASLEG